MDSSYQANPSDDHVTPTEVNQILRRKRKTRERRACYPCRQRKVKCNYESPCQRCIDRDHPDLCSYLQAPRAGGIEPPQDPPNTLDDSPRPPGADWNQLWSKLQTVELLLRDIKLEVPSHILTTDENALVRQTFSPGSSARKAYTPPLRIPTQSGLVTDECIHLGRNSVPVMAMALGNGSKEEALQDIIGKSVLPLFGLDNESATYPFTNLWGVTDEFARVREVCKLLPSDADCFQYLRQYRDNAHVLFPGVVDINELETDLTKFLIARSSPQAPASDHVNVYGQNVHCLSLLFACLASGCQCSALPRKEKQLTAQVYVCCAYECLRIVNYLSRPTIVDIQSLLVLGNVIANSMNAGVAWSLLGLTVRLAQTIGLHEPSRLSNSPDEMLLQEEVWWRIVWQDSLLSIIFDRTPSTFTVTPQRPDSVSSHRTDNLSYVDCMKRVCAVVLDIIRDRSVSTDPRQEIPLILKHRDSLAAIGSRAAPHLVEVTACRSMRDQLEHWSFHLHVSYVTSELHRPALKRQQVYAEMHLRQACIDNLANTVNAFLGLQNVSSSAKTSWAPIHKALSSALLLGIMKEQAENQRVSMLLNRFLSILADLNSDVGPSEMPAPMSRSIVALRRLLSPPPGMEVDDDEWDIDVQKLVPKRGEETPWTYETPSQSLSSTGENQDRRHSPHSVADDILWGSSTMPWSRTPSS
ncbi:uncharacterized protein Z518_08154 [Rhinocladiella mackenziei CBS 650.93]|uniref:Zn(2)-C6 fungal-type domain-containing protein n=1 Tax=Rhinocladiella mackenziei CBS 650.93 TaxID=1442369 RepID=A0A0D2J000_9EURO|nr:uncharacterized protein Z518_08154 [Rhinocladiella mackenziei CBS 650.93]KIX02215.1 hypothetical protein Z518_08154 [Rhinocladiella mackenziei CBS 650.93]